MKSKMPIAIFLLLDKPVDENSQAAISRKLPSSMNLVWAGLLAGVALLTRYNAVAFALTGGLFLLFTGGGRLIKKLQRTLVYSIIGTNPIGNLDYCGCNPNANNRLAPHGISFTGYSCTGQFLE